MRKAADSIAKATALSNSHEHWRLNKKKRNSEELR